MDNRNITNGMLRPHTVGARPRAALCIGTRLSDRRGEHSPATAGGRHTTTVIGTWVTCGQLLAAAVVAGRVFAEPLSDDVLSVVLGFAGGAVLGSLADTVRPEACDSGGPFVALATTAGFFLPFVLAA